MVLLVKGLEPRTRKGTTWEGLGKLGFRRVGARRSKKGVSEIVSAMGGGRAREKNCREGAEAAHDTRLVGRVPSPSPITRKG